MNEELPEAEILDALMYRYTRILAQQSKLKQEKENIKSDILIFIKMKEINRHISPDNIILTHKSVTRRTVDKARILEYCEKNELDFSAFEKESISERLTIKQMEVNEDVDVNNVERV